MRNIILTVVMLMALAMPVMAIDQEGNRPGRDGDGVFVPYTPECQIREIKDLAEGQCGWYQAKGGEQFHSKTCCTVEPTVKDEFYFVAGTWITHVTMLPCESPRIHWAKYYLLSINNVYCYKLTTIDPLDIGIWTRRITRTRPNNREMDALTLLSDHDYIANEPPHAQPEESADNVD
jgi:hypothetical protein